MRQLDVSEVDQQIWTFNIVTVVNFEDFSYHQFLNKKPDSSTEKELKYAMFSIRL